MTTLFLDFETRSRLDVRKVGAYRYAADPSTDVLCAGWALDDEPVRIWKRGEVNPWMEYLYDESVTLVVHNAEFERQILRERFGVSVPLRRVEDTAARSARLGCPRSLEEAAFWFKLSVQKDMEGNRVMHKLSKPRRPSKDDRSEFWDEGTKPEDFEKLYSYCMDDVAAMRDLYRATIPLEPSEREVWELTVRMNERGVKVDVPTLPLAQLAAKQASAELEQRFRGLTGEGPRSPKAAKALGLPSLDKATVRRALKDPSLSRAAREALQLRKLIARSSVSKLLAFEQRTLRDGRIRGSLTYSGAERTQRWSGSGVQPQNFPRGLGEEADLAFAALHNGVLDLIYDDVLETLAGMLRGFFVGPFFVGDYAQIEARSLAWLAGQDDLVETFARGEDVYCQMASAIWKREITKKSVDPNLPEGVTPRFIGKTTVLGAGYGLGSKKFRAQLDEVFDVEVSEEFADRAITAFRRRYPAIPKFWSLLDRAFTHAVVHKPKRIRVGPRLFMGALTIGDVPFVFIELPSGRKLYYAWPHLKEGRPHYLGRNLYKGGAWELVGTYGGKLAENVTQAFSRDLLADAMVRMDRAGICLNLTVHDEVVAEQGEHELKLFEELMKQTPPWAAGLPVGVEAFQTERYRK